MIIERPKTDSSSEWPVSGPYYLDDSNIYRVARRYEDSQSAFFSSIIQRNEAERTSFSETRPANYVSVPSRLYYPPRSSNLPLSGLRFAVKDVFDVAGLKTSVGSRDFYNFYPAKKITAAMITELLALGAVLVGKTKTTQFMNGEDPQEWIDYSCPWNPRGCLPSREVLLTVR